MILVLLFFFFYRGEKSGLTFCCCARIISFVEYFVVVDINYLDIVKEVEDLKKTITGAKKDIGKLAGHVHGVKTEMKKGKKNTKAVAHHVHTLKGNTIDNLQNVSNEVTKMQTTWIIRSVIASIFAELYLFVCIIVSAFMSPNSWLAVFSSTATTSSLFLYLGVHYCYNTFYRQLKCCRNCFGKDDKHLAQAIRAAFISFIGGTVAVAVEFGTIEGYDSLLLCLYVEACIVSFVQVLIGVYVAYRLCKKKKAIELAEERMKMEISEGMVISENGESAEKDLTDIKIRNERNTHT